MWSVRRFRREQVESDVWLWWLGARMTEFICPVLFGQIYGSTEVCRNKNLNVGLG